MELKLIDGHPHIAFKQGKREVVQKPDQAIAQARKRIADAKTMLTSLENTRREQQARLEETLLYGGSTVGARKEIATVSDLEADQDREISNAQNDICEIERLLDEHRSNEIFTAMAQNITDATAPFDTFLENLK